MAESGSKRKVSIVSRYALGDAVVLTAAVRDIVQQTGIRICPITSFNTAVWAHNPHVSQFPLTDGQVVKAHYAEYFRTAKTRPMHFMEGYLAYLNQALDVKVKLSVRKPDLYLSDIEQSPLPGFESPYWVMVAGGKPDMLTKLWPWYQQVVNLLPDIRIVQVGKQHHLHQSLSGVVDMLGKTTPRQLMQLIAHAEGVICPVTAAMHIAAAFDKPAIVIGGAREPWWWEKYDNHTFIQNVRAYDCCHAGACYRANFVGGDGLECRRPVPISDQSYAQCMHDIQPDIVADAVRSMTTNKKSRLVSLPGNHTPAYPMGEQVTLCVCFYGGEPGNEFYEDAGELKRYDNLHNRFIDGLIESTDIKRIKLRVAMNSISAGVLDRLHSLRGFADLRLFGPNQNLYKYPRLREMFYTPEIDTDWVIVMDDDVDFKHDGWLERLEGHISGAAPTDKCFGEHYMFFLSPPQRAWHQSRPWWRNRPPEIHKKFLSKVDFCAGGFWAMRFSDIKALNWPDPAIKHNHGDVALGSAIYQAGWTIHNCPRIVDEHNSPTRGYREKAPTLTASQNCGTIQL